MLDQGYAVTNGLDVFRPVIIEAELLEKSTVYVLTGGKVAGSEYLDPNPLDHAQTLTYGDPEVTVAIAFPSGLYRKPLMLLDGNVEGSEYLVPNPLEVTGYTKIYGDDEVPTAKLLLVGLNEMAPSGATFPAGNEEGLANRVPNPDAHGYSAMPGEPNKPAAK